MHASDPATVPSPRPRERANEGFPRHSEQQGPPQLCKLPNAASNCKLCSSVLPNPMPTSNTHPARRHAHGVQNAASVRSKVRHHASRRRISDAPVSSAASLACAWPHSQPLVSATTRPIASSVRFAVTSLTMLAPGRDRRARHGRLHRITESAPGPRRQAFDHWDHAACSSAFAHWHCARARRFATDIKQLLHPAAPCRARARWFHPLPQNCPRQKTNRASRSRPHHERGPGKRNSNWRARNSIRFSFPTDHQNQLR